MRLDGNNLFISFPHPKMRIPKRRLWNDPVVTSDYIFIRHSVYNVSGASIQIAPEKLAKRRTWNKKYPICIKFPNCSVVAKISPTESVENLLVAIESGPGPSSAANTTVNYNVNTAGVSVNKGNTALNASSNDTDGSVKSTRNGVIREDCSSKSLFLFARTDREKDIW